MRERERKRKRERERERKGEREGERERECVCSNAMDSWTLTANRVPDARYSLVVSPNSAMQCNHMYATQKHERSTTTCLCYIASTAYL